MKSPSVTGSLTSPSSPKGSRSRLSSRDATSTAKQRESSPDSISARSSVSGAIVFFCCAAIRVIWVIIVSRIDMTDALLLLKPRADRVDCDQGANSQSHFYTLQHADETCPCVYK